MVLSIILEIQLRMLRIWQEPPSEYSHFSAVSKSISDIRDLIREEIKHFEWIVKTHTQPVTLYIEQIKFVEFSLPHLRPTHSKQTTLGFKV